MHNRDTRIIFLSAALLIAAALFCYALPEPQDGIPRRIRFPNAGGTVVFQHAAHAGAHEIPCERCHHESTSRRDNPKPCSLCHGVAYDAAFVKTHVAKFNDNPSCATCHHYELHAKKWGHDAHAKEFDVPCRSCHHEDVLLEPEPQHCGDCHDAARPSWTKAEKGVPPAFGDAVHARCATCHEDLFEKKTKGCADCHDQKKTYDRLPGDGIVKLDKKFANCAVCHAAPAGKLIPGRMEAFHAQCMGCHENIDRGPRGKDQCGQCHTK